jgi:hypothetical protein
MAKPMINPERVRAACAQHRSLKAAAAALGVSANYLSRVRRKLGMIESDRAEKRARERAAIARPVREAAHMLGCSADHVYFLRKKHQLSTMTQENATP